MKQIFFLYLEGCWVKRKGAILDFVPQFGRFFGEPSVKEKRWGGGHDVKRTYGIVINQRLIMNLLYNKKNYHLDTKPCVYYLYSNICRHAVVGECPLKTKKNVLCMKK